MRRRKRRSIGEKQHRGFVLLFTLVTIALATVVLTRLANHRFQLLMTSNEKLEDLQRRWGSLTLRRTIAYGETAPEDLGRGFSVGLGELAFDIKVDSESKKINLNTVLLRGGRESVFAISQRAFFDSSEYVRLRPSGVGSESFSSWGDVYALEAMPDGRQSIELMMSDTNNVTCWGSGRFHYQLTPDNVLELLIPAIGFEATSKLLDARAIFPQMSLSELMEEIDLQPGEKKQLESWLTDRDDTKSIWMLVRANRNKRHLGTEFVVAQRSTNGAIELTTFQW